MTETIVFQEPEIWRPVVSYGGIFKTSHEVSNWGRVRSLDRWIKHSRGGKRLWKGRKELNQENSRYNKKRVVLYKDGERYKMMVHVVMAKTYPEICGEWFEGCHVHHKDGNPSNNNAYNLQVLTKEEHKLIHNEYKKVIQLTENGNVIATFNSLTDAANSSGCDVSHISKCCLGKAKTTGGYIFKFAS